MPGEIPDGFTTIDLPKAGFVAANGPVYGKLEDGRCVIGLRVEERHCNSVGTCHGGMLAFLADVLLAVGSSAEAGLDRFLPTISLSCDFVAPARLGDFIEGRLSIVSITRTLVFSEGRLSVDGQPIVRANGIFKLRRDDDPTLKRDHRLS